MLSNAILRTALRQARASGWRPVDPAPDDEPTLSAPTGALTVIDGGWPKPARRTTGQPEVIA